MTTQSSITHLGNQISPPRNIINPRLDALPDYPFERLRTLLDPLAAPANLPPIALSLGEPQHPYPDFVGDILHANRHLYGKYPPVAGTPEFRRAVADWLTRRYDLPEGMLDPDRHIAPCAGTREALFRTAFMAVPPEKSGQQPVVLMPNPFYQCYAGAAIAAGAEPVFVPALSENGFLPDFSGLDDDILARTALVYFCTPGNPQGAVADLAYLENLVALSRKYDFTLVVDECYAEIYNGDPPPGTLQVCAAQNDDMSGILVFHSLSKRSNVAGLRSGFVAGDGEMLMGMGTLATIAVQSPPNLAVCVIDNQRYGETGMQETHTAHGVDLPAMAAGAGFQTTSTVYTSAELNAAIPVLYNEPGPVFVDVKITAVDQPMTLPPRDGPTLKHRFRENLLGSI